MPYKVNLPDECCENCRHVHHDNGEMRLTCMAYSLAQDVPPDGIVESAGHCENWSRSRRPNRANEYTGSIYEAWDALQSASQVFVDNGMSPPVRREAEAADLASYLRDIEFTASRLRAALVEKFTSLQHKTP